MGSAKKREETRKAVVLRAAIEVMKLDFERFLKRLRNEKKEFTEENLSTYCIGYKVLRNLVAKKLKPTSRDAHGNIIQTNSYFNINDAFFLSTIETDISFFNSKKIVLKKGDVVRMVHPLYPLELAAEINRGANVINLPIRKRELPARAREEEKRLTARRRKHA